MTTNKTKKDLGNLWSIVALLLFASLIVAGYKFKNSMMEGISESALLDKSCDLRKGACITKLPSGGQVSFSINPKDIPILRPLILMVETQGLEPISVEVDLIGIGMDMGYNRSKLEKTDNNNFTGKAIIPVCVRSKMSWEARVLLKTDKDLIMVPFRFYTLK